MNGSTYVSPISFNGINIELGLSGTTNKSINDCNYRTLATVASGTIEAHLI